MIEILTVTCRCGAPLTDEIARLRADLAAAQRERDEARESARIAADAHRKEGDRAIAAESALSESEARRAEAVFFAREAVTEARSERDAALQRAEEAEREVERQRTRCQDWQDFCLRHPEILPPEPARELGELRCRATSASTTPATASGRRWCARPAWRWRSRPYATPTAGSPPTPTATSSSRTFGRGCWWRSRSPQDCKATARPPRPRRPEKRRAETRRGFRPF